MTAVDSDRIQGEIAAPGTSDVLSGQRTALMGVAIIMILIFHYTEDCKIYEAHYGGFVEWYKTYVGSSSVDLFLFLSGLGLYFSMKKNPGVAGFYRRRLVRILIPYLAVAIPAWYVYDVVLTGESAGRFFRDLTFVTFFTEGVRWFWYIGAILAGYLVYPLVFLVVDRCRSGILRAAVLLLAVLAVTVCAAQMRESNPELFGDINIVVLRIPAFLIGCFYGRVSYENRRVGWLWLPAAAASVYFVSKVPEADSVIYVRYALATANISLCACGAGLLKLLQKAGPLYFVISWFGTHSLELYLTHVAIRRIMCELGYLTCEPLYEAVMVALAVGSAWLLGRIGEVRIGRRKECAG